MGGQEAIGARLEWHAYLVYLAGYERFWVLVPITMCEVENTHGNLGRSTVGMHVRQADESVHIGASPARESYLVGDKIIAAAREAGAEAIHPGYGFLSENADFAQAVIDAGLIWVGPRPDSRSRVEVPRGPVR